MDGYDDNVDDYYERNVFLETPKGFDCKEKHRMQRL